MMTTSPMYALRILVSLHGSLSRDDLTTYNSYLIWYETCHFFHISLNPLLYMKVEKEKKVEPRAYFSLLCWILGNICLLEIYINLCFILPISSVSPTRKLVASLMIKFIYLFFSDFEIYLLAFDDNEWFLIDFVLYINITWILSNVIIKIDKDFSTDLKMWPVEREVGNVDFLKLLN